MRYYFAYGSNLCRTRLLERVPSAEPVGVALLAAHRLVWNKRGVDGSAKCNVEPASDSGVWGAVIAMTPPGVEALDRIEPGYARSAVRIRRADSELDAFTYVALPESVDADLRPFTWYRDLVVAGAHQIGLPAAYVESLRAVETRADGDRARARRNRAAMPCGRG